MPQSALFASIVYEFKIKWRRTFKFHVIAVKGELKPGVF